MIDISVRNDIIIVKGHAHYEEPGKDIVCAGVSVLVQTLIKSIEDLTEDKIETDIKPGLAIIKYRDLSEKTKTMVDLFFIGICQIAEEYPEYVRIS